LYLKNSPLYTLSPTARALRHMKRIPPVTSFRGTRVACTPDIQFSVVAQFGNLENRLYYYFCNSLTLIFRQYSGIKNYYLSQCEFSYAGKISSVCKFGFVASVWLYRNDATGSSTFKWVDWFKKNKVNTVFLFIYIQNRRLLPLVPLSLT